MEMTTCSPAKVAVPRAVQLLSTSMTFLVPSLRAKKMRICSLAKMAAPLSFQLLLVSLTSLVHSLQAMETRICWLAKAVNPPDLQDVLARARNAVEDHHQHCATIALARMERPLVLLLLHCLRDLQLFRPDHCPALFPSGHCL